MTKQSLNKKILVADDNDFWRKFVRMTLSDLKPNVSFANDGREAYAMLLAKNYDLLISDTNMPEVNGLELIKMIRETGSNIPILLFFSGLKNSPLTADDAYKMGASAVIEKEDAMNRLFRLVEELLLCS